MRLTGRFAIARVQLMTPNGSLLRDVRDQSVTNVRPVHAGGRKSRGIRLTVAQAVMEEGEKFARGGDPGDVAAAPFGDAPIVNLDLVVAMVLRHGLNAAQRSLAG